MKWNKTKHDKMSYVCIDLERIARLKQNTKKQCMWCDLHIWEFVYNQTKTVRKMCVFVPTDECPHAENNGKDVPLLFLLVGNINVKFGAAATILLS